MKQPFTASVFLSRQLTQGMRNLIMGLGVMGMVLSPVMLPDTAGADRFDDQINAIQREINQSQAVIKDLQARAGSLQAEVNKLAAEKNIIQSQIDLNQAKYEQLLAQIAETEKKIVNNKNALGEIVADLYVDDAISPLEMLASSGNIGDYVDKQTYRSSIRDTLSDTIQNIKALKKELEQKKKDTEKILADQKAAREALVAKESEQQDLLNRTRGEEASYQQMVAEKEGQKLQIQKAQQEAIEAAVRRAGGGSVSILPGDPNKGGYPWELNCYVDANAYSHGGVFYPGAGGYNGLDGMGTNSAGAGAYGCRQCVSYAAWKVYQKTGQRWSGMGNANQWPGNAPGLKSRQPRKNSLGVISAGQYGHIVYVEDTYEDGTIKISQYNYYNAGGSGWGHYSEMRVSASTYDTYIYL